MIDKDFKMLMRKVVTKHNQNLDNYLNRKLFDTNTDQSFVLRTHLLVESLTNDILDTSMPKSNLIERMQFHNKITVFEAIGLDNDDKDLLIAIKVINEIRNEFAHNIDFKLASKKAAFHLRKVSFDGKVLEGKSNREKFFNLTLFVAAYLRTMVSMHTLFPLVSSIGLNYQILDKDKWFRSRKLTKIIRDELIIFTKDDDLSEILTSAEKSFA